MDTYDGPTVPTYNISTPVDHFDDSNNETYNNRYWINDTYYHAGGPVFFYDFGEQGVTDQLAARSLAEVNRTSAVMRLAEQYNGMAVAWEHRYFGESLPVPLNQTTNQPVGDIEGYRYLTIEQALEDVVYFAKHFCPDGYTKEQCFSMAPSQAPWIWLGGSYPGLRGALLRIRNPEILYAVWASSAPVQAMVNGSAYYTPITASLPSNCSADIQAVVKYVDEIMSGDHGEEAFQYLQNLTLVADIASTSNSDNNLTYDLSEAQYYAPYDIATILLEPILSDFQTEGPSNTTDIFCNYLESFDPNGIPGNDTDVYIATLSNPANGTVSDDGIVATYNASVGLNAYMYAYSRFYYEFLEHEFNQESFELPYDYTSDHASWEWLVVSQFGWFQGSNPDNVTIVSRFANVSAIREQSAFMTFYNASALPDTPDLDSINKYGGWNMTPSNVMFTVGEFDPWRGGTPLSEEVEIGAPVRNVTTDIPPCGRAPNGTDVFGAILPGAVHAQDLELRNGSSIDGTLSYQISFSLFTQALDVWLDCFNSSNANSTS